MKTELHHKKCGGRMTLEPVSAIERVPGAEDTQELLCLSCGYRTVVVLSGGKWQFARKPDLKSKATVTV